MGCLYQVAPRRFGGAQHGRETRHRPVTLRIVQSQTVQDVHQNSSRAEPRHAAKSNPAARRPHDHGELQGFLEIARPTALRNGSDVRGRSQACGSPQRQEPPASTFGRLSLELQRHLDHTLPARGATLRGSDEGDPSADERGDGRSRNEAPAADNDARELAVGDV